MNASPARGTQVRFGRIHADSVTLAEALDLVAEGVAGKKGGFVVTPNVDHIVLAETDDELRDAYQQAFLSLVDGQPLMWLARAFGHPLPEKLSGSDFVEPLAARAAEEGWGVYLLGGMPGIGEAAAQAWARRYPHLRVVGIDSPPLGFDHDELESRRVFERIAAAAPDILMVALGCPKQELWMHRHVDKFSPAIAFGIGASLDFVAGKVGRAPTLVSSLGMEWAYRLLQEPRRLAHRYLVRDRAIFSIALADFRRPQAERARPRDRG